jgi:hypothetical protein
MLAFQNRRVMDPKRVRSDATGRERFCQARGVDYHVFIGPLLLRLTFRLFHVGSLPPNLIAAKDPEYLPTSTATGSLAHQLYRERNISRTHVLFSLVSASACISRPRGRLRIIMLLPGITAAHKENLVAGFSSTGLQRTSSCQLPSNI